MSPVQQGLTVPSTSLNPALAPLHEALAGLHPDKWKASSAIRQEAANNLDSIRRDLEQTLPPLLADADAHPNAVSHILPLERNLSALYDVLIRVDAVADIAAPTPQADALEQATAALKDTRHDFADAFQALAAAQEQQFIALKASAARAAATPAPQPICPTPTPPAAKKKPKPTAKPT